MPNKSFKLSGPLVTRLAVVEKPRQAARQPSLQLNSTVRRVSKIAKASQRWVVR